MPTPPTQPVEPAPIPASRGAPKAPVDTDPGDAPGAEPDVASGPEGHRSIPPTHAEGLLRWGGGVFQRLDALIHRGLPQEQNPLLQTGAIANTALIIAIVTGVVLLIWYSPSVHKAYASVLAMESAPWTAGLVRSLHRYSSDACLLFAFIHGLKLFCARRFFGARWLAWVTGVLLVVLLWVVGWLGYWLVWDQRAQQVAVGTSKLLDALPIFIDPLARSFVANASVNSLLFFVVFFFHMLAPLGMGVAIWLHIAHLSRSRFLTDRRMTLWVLGSLVVVSLVYPATAAEPASMSVTPQTFTLDAWFLAPLALTDRLSGGALWAVTLLGFAISGTVPWWMRKGRAPDPVRSRVIPAQCDGCRTCYTDCPFNAINMVARSDGRTDVTEVAFVDPDRCVSCGICTGSCDTGGVGLPWLGARDERRRIEAWLEESAQGDGEQASIAILCAESASRYVVEMETGRCADLPGYRALKVPCLGWINVMVVERALRKGAQGVLLVGCPEGACSFREGPEFATLRLEAKRQPALRHDRVDIEQIRVLRVGHADAARLPGLAKAFRAGQLEEGRLGVEAPKPAGMRAAIAGVVLAAALGVATLLPSNLPYTTPIDPSPSLVVSFKHPGEVSEVKRTLTEEELAALPIHMRKAEVTAERRRADVRLRIAVDGEVLLEKAYAPKGIWGDGNSIAVASVSVAPGPHEVRVEIGDTHDEAVWGFQTEVALEFAPGRRTAVIFDRLDGFTWHGTEEQGQDK